jgi:hypothetical protein
MNSGMEEPYELPRKESSDEQFMHLMDEIEVLAAVLEDVEGEAVADQITMWIDYMIYRALYADEEASAECAPEARECRRLVMAHLDEVAWGDVRAGS